MSYCRFENTYEDFKQCLYAVRDREQLSETEELYASNLYELAKEYINAYEQSHDDESEDEELDAEYYVERAKSNSGIAEISMI